MASRQASDEIAMRPSRGRGSTGSGYQTHMIKASLSEAIDVPQGNTWLPKETSIFNRTHQITSRNQASDGLHVDSHRHLTADRGRSRTTIDVRSWPDRRAIVARSWRDRRSFEAKSRPRSSSNDGPRSPSDHHHQSYLSTGWNGRNFRAEISFKKTMYSLFSLQLMIDSWSN